MAKKKNNDKPLGCYLAFGGLWLIVVILCLVALAAVWGDAWSEWWEMMK